MIEIEKIEPCDDLHFIKPQRVVYRQNGVIKRWEIVQTHDSVAILLYHKTKKAFVLVKQFRPAVFLKNGEGYTYELCAGLIDKAGKSIEEIAKEEVFEECGYDLTNRKIVRITSFFTAVGFAGGEQTLFFAEVDETIHTSEGGGVDDEQIEVIYLPVLEARSFMFDETKAKTPGLLFAFMWFFEQYGG